MISRDAGSNISSHFSLFFVASDVPDALCLCQLRLLLEHNRTHSLVMLLSKRSYRDSFVSSESSEAIRI